MGCIEVQYGMLNNSGVFEIGTIGFFKDREEVKNKLAGLCSWDFDSMWGSAIEHGFRFIEHPFDITNHNTSDREADIKRARKHAREWKHVDKIRWNGVFPKNEEEE